MRSYLIAGLAPLAILSVLSSAHAQDWAPEDITAERISDLVARVKPTQALAWTRIPWAASLTQARQASQTEGAPVFLFAYLGNIRLNRC